MLPLFAVYPETSGSMRNFHLGPTSADQIMAEDAPTALQEIGSESGNQPHRVDPPVPPFSHTRISVIIVDTSSVLLIETCAH